MNVKRAAEVLVSLLLGFFVVYYATRVAGREGAHAEVGRVKLTELSPALAERVASLNDRLHLVYYVSPAVEMPSHMRRIERQVTDLLETMKDAGGGRVEYHIIDPTQDPDLKRFAGRRKVAPVRVRSVSHEGYSEQEVWSTLTVEYGARPPILISAIGPEHLPRLQSLLVEHIGQLERPRRPVFALAAPAEGYRELRAFLAQVGEVRDLSFELNPQLPPDADVLFWIEPKAVDETLLRNIQHFIDSGRHVVVAGGAYASSVEGDDLVLRPSGFDAEALLGSFGLRQVKGLMLDQKPAPMALPTGEADTPFRVTCLGINQDFQSMAKEPRGTLLFVTPTPFELEPEKLAELGWQAEILATSSDQTTLLDEPGNRLPVAALTNAGSPVAKQPLLVWLRNVDPWAGSLVACGSANIFRDETFVIDTLAHKRLTDVLVATLASDESLVLARANRERPAPLPALPGGDRVFWRAMVVFLLPALLAVYAVWRLRRSGPRVARGDKVGGLAPALAVRLLGGAVAIGLIVAFTSGGLRADLTSAGLNELAEMSRELARDATGVEVELIASSPDRLPPEMRPLMSRLDGLLDEYERHGADFTRRRIYPEDLDDAGRAALEAEGVTAVKVTSERDEVTTVRRIYSVLRLRRGDRVEQLRFNDVDAFENLEFRITFALWRLKTGRRPHIGFASDIPRLSSAENYQFFQSRGLIAPSGKDVYSLARGVLSGCDFRVTHISPREPQIPDDLDLLIWIQPRRTVKPMLEATVDYLYRGGAVIVAAQHFVMQSRQYRGTEFKFNYWPQPQSPDVEEFYYPDLGVMMVREVLFDAAQFMAELVTIVFRSARREFISMRHAKPFNVRALPPNFDPESLITRNLGDLPFLFPAFFRLDPDRLAELGLKATPIISTTARSWTLDWKGGWIPDGYLPESGEQVVFSAPGEGVETSPEDARPAAALGSAPMAVLVEGQFPWPQKEFVHPPRIFGPDGQLEESEGPPDYAFPEPVDQAKPGRLLLIGESEMWKDQRLTELRDEFRADHLLVNASCALGLEPALAEVVTRRAVARGFEPIPQREQIRWRVFVYSALPLLMLVWFLLRAALARGPST